jgi:hypothetical protein
MRRCTGAASECEQAERAYGHTAGWFTRGARADPFHGGPTLSRHGLDADVLKRVEDGVSSPIAISSAPGWS